MNLQKKNKVGTLIAGYNGNTTVSAVSVVKSTNNPIW